MAIAPIGLGFRSGLQNLVFFSNPESTPLWVVGGRREVICSPPWVVLWLHLFSQAFLSLEYSTPLFGGRSIIVLEWHLWWFRGAFIIAYSRWYLRKVSLREVHFDCFAYMWVVISCVYVRFVGEKLFCWARVWKNSSTIQSDGLIYTCDCVAFYFLPLLRLKITPKLVKVKTWTMSNWFDW